MSISKHLPELHDIDKVLFLYSNNNATTDEVKIFWEKAICVFCKSIKRSFIFSLHDLIEHCTVHGVRPSYVNKTIQELITRDSKSDSKKLIREYSHPPKDEQLSMLFAAFSLATQYLTSPNHSHSTTNFFVCVKLLDEVCSLIQDYVNTLDDKECVFLVEEGNDITFNFSFIALLRNFNFKEETNRDLCDLIQSISLVDKDILLESLVTNKMAVFSNDKKVIKLLKKKRIEDSSSESNYLFSFLFRSSNTPVVESVLEYEVTRLQLQLSINSLERKIKELEDKAGYYRLKALDYKKTCNNQMALLHLNLRRNVLQTRDKVANALIDLMDAFERIDAASVNKLITDAYTAAAKGLRAGREQAGLTVENVDEAIEAFQHEMDEMKEISSVLESQQLNVLTAEDELALESELDLLMNSTENFSSDPEALPLKTTVCVTKKKDATLVDSVVADDNDGVTKVTQEAKPVGMM
mmetsp:Transcript_23663/g.33925  ORF Transcript_23663/g.33925 Transcript_23663/m.33925 type:complete len:467 (+) Transcript_23663:63-1463(+)